MTDMEREVMANDDPIMPDDYQEGDDILAGLPEDDPLGILDTPSDTTPAEETAGAPATEPTEETTEGDSTPETTPANESDQTVNAEKPKLRFKYKYDREEREAELDESDLPDVYERAQATDRYKERLSKADPIVKAAEQLARTMGYESASEMLQDASDSFRTTSIEKLVEDGTPREIAEDYIDRKMGRVVYGKPVDGESGADLAGPAGDPGVPQESQAASTRDYAAEAAALLNIRPELRGKSLPDEVMKDATEGGQNLVQAYLNYEAKQRNAELEKLRRENQIYKQNAEAASRSPVKSTTGGGETDTSTSDPFLAGLNSDYY